VVKERPPGRKKESPGDAGVMAGGDRIESQQVGALAEAMELEMPVALDARIGRQSVAVG